MDLVKQQKFDSSWNKCIGVAKLTIGDYFKVGVLLTIKKINRKINNNNCSPSTLWIIIPPRIICNRQERSYYKVQHFKSVIRVFKIGTAKSCCKKRLAIWVINRIEYYLRFVRCHLSNPTFFLIFFFRDVNINSINIYAYL